MAGDTQLVLGFFLCESDFIIRFSLHMDKKKPIPKEKRKKICHRCWLLVIFFLTINANKSKMWKRLRWHEDSLPENESDMVVHHVRERIHYIWPLLISINGKVSISCVSMWFGWFTASVSIFVCISLWYGLQYLLWPSTFQFARISFCFAARKKITARS